MNKKRLNEDFYSPVAFCDKDKTILKSISNENIAAINNSIAAISDLLRNLQTYKACIIDSINLEAESADLASKYGNSSKLRGQQPYLLPGVVNTPTNYDIKAIKDDSKRMMDIQSDRQKAASQKDVYLRLCKEDVKVFMQQFKKMQYSEIVFDQFITNLNNSINQSY